MTHNDQERHAASAADVDALATTLQQCQEALEQAAAYYGGLTVDRWQYRRMRSRTNRALTAAHSLRAALDNAAPPGAYQEMREATALRPDRDEAARRMRAAS